MKQAFFWFMYLICAPFLLSQRIAIDIGILIALALYLGTLMATLSVESSDDDAESNINAAIQEIKRRVKTVYDDKNICLYCDMSADESLFRVGAFWPVCQGHLNLLAGLENKTFLSLVGTKYSVINDGLNSTPGVRS